MQTLDSEVRIWDQVDSGDAPHSHSTLNTSLFNSLSTDTLQQTENDMQENSQVNSAVALGNVPKLFLGILISIQAERSCGQTHL